MTSSFLRVFTPNNTSGSVRFLASSVIGPGPCKNQWHGRLRFLNHTTLASISRSDHHGKLSRKATSQLINDGRPPLGHHGFFFLGYCDFHGQNKANTVIFYPFHVLNTHLHVTLCLQSLQLRLKTVECVPRESLVILYITMQCRQLPFVQFFKYSVLSEYYSQN